MNATGGSLKADRFRRWITRYRATAALVAALALLAYWMCVRNGVGVYPSLLGGLFSLERLFGF